MKRTFFLGLFFGTFTITHTTLSMMRFFSLRQYSSQKSIVQKRLCHDVQQPTHAEILKAVQYNTSLLNKLHNDIEKLQLQQHPHDLPNDPNKSFKPEFGMHYETPEYK